MKSGRLIAATVAIVSAATLSSCATTTLAVSAPVEVTGTVSGTIERVGGPISPDGTQPTPVPLAATAVVYPRTNGQVSLSGNPLESVASSSSEAGHFTFSIKPGRYFVVARMSDGSLASNPKAITVTRGDTTSVDLIVAVP